MGRWFWERKLIVWPLGEAVTTCLLRWSPFVRPFLTGGEWRQLGYRCSSGVKDLPVEGVEPWLPQLRLVVMLYQVGGRRLEAQHACVSVRRDWSVLGFVSAYMQR